jgi:hypothetical protein
MVGVLEEKWPISVAQVLSIQLVQTSPSAIITTGSQ